MSELLYQMALTQIPNVGAVTAKNLIGYCGSAEAVFKSNKKTLLKIPNIGEVTANMIIKCEVLSKAEKEIRFAEKHEVQLLSYTDAAYPDRLKHRHDAPVVLFYKGNADLNHGRIISIVGTRQPTPYGIKMCEQIVEELLPYNVLIVSGLAYGIDITAHRKSLDLDIPTVAVMGTGLQRIYPHENKNTAQKMCDNGGLLTEYFSEQKPDREHFPMRNRIIAGMCDAVLIIETAAKGGSMITAKQAINLGKETFAVPGRVGDKLSEGCNELIKQRLAHVLESVKDIAYILRWEELDVNHPAQLQLFPSLNDSEKIIFDTIKQFDAGVLIDAISFLTKKNHGEIAGTLLSLEFKGVVRALPGKKFIVI